MKLSQRTCDICGSNFDLLEDKYFVKKPSRIITLINILLKILVVTSDMSFNDHTLICESCHRDQKIKKLIK
jgi:hypothetical protein